MYRLGIILLIDYVHQTINKAYEDKHT